MDDQVKQAQFLAELGFLEDVIRKLGYRTHLKEPGPDLPYPMLSVNLEPAKASGQVALTYYPVPEGDAGDLKYLQYYAIVPGTEGAAEFERAAGILPFLNARLVLGHFGISEAPPLLYFRYVQALPDTKLATSEDIADILVMIGAALDLFAGILVEYLQGKLDLGQARAAIQSKLQGK